MLSVNWLIYTYTNCSYANELLVLSQYYYQWTDWSTLSEASSTVSIYNIYGNNVLIRLRQLHCNEHIPILQTRQSNSAPLPVTLHHSDLTCLLTTVMHSAADSCSPPGPPPLLKHNHLLHWLSVCGPKTWRIMLVKIRLWGRKACCIRCCRQTTSRPSYCGGRLAVAR